MNPKLNEKRKELEAKQDKLAAIFKEAGPERDMDKIASLTGSKTEKLDEIRRRMEELTAIGKDVDELAAIERASDDLDRALKDRKEPDDRPPLPGAKGGDRPELKSLGRQFVESKDFQNARKNSLGRASVEIDVDLKTAMTTSAGFAPESLRTGEVVPYVRRPLSVLDLIPAGRTTQAAVVYMEQTTRTNNAAEATENSGAFGEAALAYTERSVTVENVAQFIPVTMQQLEDVPQIEGVINGELMSMERERVDSQVLNGSGSTPEIQGILNKTGILTRARAGDVFDTVFNAAKDVRVTGRSNPNAIVIHPNDWAEIRLMRTEDGLYILGNPTELGPERIWGMSVVQSTAITEATALVGDFASWCKLYEKRGVLLEMTDSHDTYFIYGKYAIRATWRVAMVITRPAAFCKITSM